MLSDRVKTKLQQSVSIWLILLALVSFLASWAGLFPASFVEQWYAAGLYPLLSRIITLAANAIPVSWLDLLIVFSVPFVIFLGYRRNLLTLFGFAAVGYLFFFWSWGLNYHRQPLVSKLEFKGDLVTEEAVSEFTTRTAFQLNQLYPKQEAVGYDERGLGARVGTRVTQVVEELDGTSWIASGKFKSSRILDPFFRAAGVDGMFNPFGHEALVTSGLLPFERPMILAHEAAHVRGYPNEGEASFIALMACINSNDPAFRYSGWLTLWLYLRYQETDELLDEGPRQDLDALFTRRRANQVVWVRDIQARTLDLFLKANRVESGIRSYERMVTLAVGTESSWERFAEKVP